MPYDDKIFLTFTQYVDCLIAFGGKTRKEAEKIARSHYEKQHGKTPEKHREELNGQPCPPFFDSKEECEWIGDNKVDN